MSDHRLVFGGGAQTIRTVPIREDGRPLVVSSATYAIVDTRRSADDGAYVVEQGNATIDSVSTTLAAAAGKATSDPRQLSVASAAGIVEGRRYLLQSGGRADLVQVVGIAGTTLRLSTALTSYVPSGATFRGVELSGSVSSDVTGEDDYLVDSLCVRWTPEGLASFLEQLFLERTAPATLVTADEVLRLDPDLAGYATENMSAADAVREALDDFRVDLLAAGVEDDQVLAGPIGRRAVIHLAAWHLIKHRTESSAVSRAERYHGRYSELRNSLLQGRDKAKTARLTADNAREPPDARSRFAGSW